MGVDDGLRANTIHMIIVKVIAGGDFFLLLLR
jgi:hypothetical protein